MATEFELSLIEHAVTSGRGANCFFQSFMHTLTSLTQDKLAVLQHNYSNSIDVFVATFNSQLQLAPPVGFDVIMKISRALHPLERECVFGPILRHTYNAMIDKGLLIGDKLQYHSDAIVLSFQTTRFANAFGAVLSIYMSEEQFELSIKSGMPGDIENRTRETHFQIGNKVFYCDRSPQEEGHFELCMVYADKHLNYTLGSRALNNVHRSAVITKRMNSADGIYAIAPSLKGAAPMAEGDIKFADIAGMVSDRFQLKREQAAILPSLGNDTKTATAPTPIPLPTSKF